MAVKAVLFDFGGVLYGRSADANLKAYRNRLEAVYGLPRGILKETLKQAEQNLHAPSLDRDDPVVLATAHELLEQAAGSPLPPLHAWWRQHRRDGRGLVEENIELLRQLRGRYLTGIVSNHDGTLAERLGCLGVGDLFDLVVDSGVEGVEKPDARIYELALSRLKVAPEESVFVDNLPENLAGARAVGIQAIHYQLHDAHSLSGLLAAAGVSLGPPDRSNPASQA